MISFQVVIMALLGGTGRLWGPLLGVIPFTILFDHISAHFPEPHQPGHRHRLHGDRLLSCRAASSGSSTTIRQSCVAGLPKLAPTARRLRNERARLCCPSNGAQAFGGLVAVNDVIFEVKQGELIGLIGPNGSGKTTMLNLISGALQPTAGHIRLDGENISGMPAHEIARRGVARTFQLVRVAAVAVVRWRTSSPARCSATCRAWGDDAYREAEILLERVGLGGRGDAPTGSMTYIDQKRLELARALASNPRLLLLDEWLAGLNPSELKIGIDLIRASAQGRPHDHHGRARHGCHPLAVRPLRRDVERRQDRRRVGASTCCRSRKSITRLSGSRRCLRSTISPSPTARTGPWRMSRSASRQARSA